MKVRQNMKRNKRILESLLTLRTPHPRMKYCQKPTPKMAKWWARRLRKREQKRLERLEKAMAKFLGMKKRKMTQRELKQQRRQDVLSGLSKGVRERLPHFRMLYRAVNIAGPLAHDLQRRKHDKKIMMLEAFKKEHSLLCAEIKFLTSQSSEAETNQTVLKMCRLTQEKMFWDYVFNDVKALLKLIKTKIAENGTTLERLKSSMNKNYFRRKAKEQNLVTQPAYFGEIEYHLYPEKRLHTRKSIKERYLEDLAEIETLFMALEKKGEELNHYLRTRELFRSVLDKILNRLNRGKKIVLDSLQDGHNLMNDLTMRILDLMSMKKLTNDVDEELVSRRRQAQNERAIKVQETKDLMARHRPNFTSSTYEEIWDVSSDKARPIEEVREEAKRGFEVFLRSILAMGGLADREGRGPADFTKMSKQLWIPQAQTMMHTNQFLMQKIAFPLIESNDYKKRVEELWRTVLEKKQERRDLKDQVREHKKRLEPLLECARAARYRVRVEFLTLYKTWKYFLEPFRELYGLLDRKPSFNAHKLGIHNRMTEYNKLDCLNALLDSIPYYVAKLVHAEMQEGTKYEAYNAIVRGVDHDRLRWKRYQRILELVRPQTAFVRKRMYFDVTEHPPLEKSPCPLCCVEERLSKMALVEEFEDHIRSVFEIRCELRDTQEMEDLKSLNHPIWECNQPAARSLIQLLILEDRTGEPGKIMDFTKVAQ